MLEDIPGVSKNGESICLQQWVVISVGIAFGLLIFALGLLSILSIRECWLIHQSRKHKADEEDEKERLVEIAEDVGVSHKEQ
ncbi:hypothetical protein IAT38_003897 [Cryptococcus sp. DSM 104549]